MPIDHFSLMVPESKFEGIINFLVTSLKPIGFKEYMRPIPTAAGLGDARPYLWIKAVPEGPNVLELCKQNHMAFTADTPAQVDEFHALAVKAGGKDNREPGLRPQYGPNYYAAFVCDPVCGVNFEVICRAEAS